MKNVAQMLMGTASEHNQLSGQPRLLNMRARPMEVTGKSAKMLMVDGLWSMNLGLWFPVVFRGVQGCMNTTTSRP